MSFSRPRLPHLLICGFAASCGIVVALVLRSPVAAALALIPVAAIWASWSMPRKVAATATWIARGGALAVIVAGLILSAYPVVPERELFAVVSNVALVLLSCGGLLLLARQPPGAGVSPAMIGALVAAFLHPDAPWVRTVSGFAAIFLVAWLVSNDDGRAAPRRVRLLPASIFLVIAASAAAGVAMLLPWAQPQVELYAARMISNDLEAAVGLSTESRLGEVEQLAQSKRIALRYYADRASNLRVRVFTGFDGRAWKADPRRPQALQKMRAPAGLWPLFDETPGLASGLTAVAPPADLLSARVVVRSPERGAMPVPAHTVAVKVEDVAIEYTPSGVLLPSSRAAVYAVLFAAAAPDESAPGPEMLAVPEKIDPRLRDLAATLAGASRTPAEIVDRVVGHFQSGYRYSLNVGAFRTGDPVAEFVFEKKKGYCEYFASANTLLLRLAGVPARYVTGYAVRPFHRSGSHYVIRDSDAHAWTEAYIPGRGWVEADATPAGDYEAVHGNPPNGGIGAAFGALYDEAAALFAQGGSLGLLRGLGRTAFEHPVGLALLVAAAMALKFRKRLRRMRASSALAPTDATTYEFLTPQMRSLLGSLDTLFAQRGSPRRPSRAPREHALDPAVALQSDERPVCLKAVDLLYSQAYGGAPPDIRELEAMTTTLTTLAAPGMKRRLD